MKFYFVLGNGREPIVMFHRLADNIIGLARELGISVGMMLTVRHLGSIDFILDLNPFGGDIIIDNGAFAVLSGNWDARFVLSPEQKRKWFSKLVQLITKVEEFEWYAMPDLPVHGREFAPPNERRRRIELSAELHEEFASEWHHDPQRARPVLQGYTAGEYAYSFTLLARLFGKGAYYAVGSVCVRKKLKNLGQFMEEFLGTCCPVVLSLIHI